MTRDARLPHPENFLELRHRQLFLFQQEEQPKPGWIGQEAEKING
jgi:hypothetical protein